ncbi:MAG TPA: hypothetical protein VIL34_11685 [Actinopolymorphaceae bacterium]|jgi:hypothetical protein
MLHRYLEALGVPPLTAEHVNLEATVFVELQGPTYPNVKEYTFEEAQ